MKGLGEWALEGYIPFGCDLPRRSRELIRTSPRTHDARSTTVRVPPLVLPKNSGTRAAVERR
jgi:hypothetical protein